MWQGGEGCIEANNCKKSHATVDVHGVRRSECLKSLKGITFSMFRGFTLLRLEKYLSFLSREIPRACYLLRCLVKECQKPSHSKKGYERICIHGSLLWRKSTLDSRFVMQKVQKIFFFFENVFYILLLCSIPIVPNVTNYIEDLEYRSNTEGSQTHFHFEDFMKVRDFQSSTFKHSTCPI